MYNTPTHALFHSTLYYSSVLISLKYTKIFNVYFNEYTKIFNVYFNEINTLE